MTRLYHFLDRHPKVHVAIIAAGAFAVAYLEAHP